MPYKKTQSKIILILAAVIILLAHYSIRASGQDISQLTQESEGGADEADTIIRGGMDGRISLDLRNIDIIDALKFLSLKTGMNIVATKNVAGRVTLTVNKVVVRDIFDIMLRSNDLAYIKQGDIYNIMTEVEYNSLYGKDFSDLRLVKTFRLKYAIPDQAFTLLDTLKSDIGRVLVEPETGTVIIMDTPESIEVIEKALATMEQKNIMRVFSLQYANAKDVEEQLKSQLNVKKVGTIRADERMNQVIVQALPDRMRDIEALITALDKKTKQVLIETKIVKIKVTDRTDKAFEWEGIFKIAERYGMTYLGSYPFSGVQLAADAWRDRRQVLREMGGRVGGYPYSGFTSDFDEAGSSETLGENIHIGMVNRLRDFDMTIQYLQTLGNTQILSQPKIAVVNNQEARIHVGERQAYVTTTTTSGSTTTTVSEEVTFVDVGIKLSVTPTVNDEGYITMKIKPEVSSVVDHLITPTGNEIPIIDTSHAETTVLVKDGSSIIIGGMRKDEKLKDRKQTPFLGEIPILGFLFGSGHESTERTELLIIITPRIVSGDRLIAGPGHDGREYGYDVTKDYREYTPFTTETNFEPAETRAESEPAIKPYRDY